MKLLLLLKALVQLRLLVEMHRASRQRQLTWQLLLLLLLMLLLLLLLWLKRELLRSQQPA